MYKLINVIDYPKGLESAARYIHDKWGNEDNFKSYLDSILHSSKTEASLPKFYLALKGEEVVGCFALLTNDLNSRQDLWPWVACVFVEEKERGNRLCVQMFDLAKLDARRGGFNVMYLFTDHTTLYEQFGWERIEDGYDHSGEKSRIYKMATG